MDELRAVMQKTITSFNRNNTAAIKTKDVTLLSSVLTENCIKLYRPLSFINRYPQFLKTENTNAEYEAQTQMKFATYADVEQNVYRTVIDAHQRVANVWIEKIVYLVDGSKSSVEVVYDLEFTQDGKQISRYTEFVDTFESAKVLEQNLSKIGAS